MQTQCDKLDLRSELQQLHAGNYAGDLIVQMLNELILPDPATGKRPFPITLAHSKWLAVQMLNMQDMDSGHEFRQVQVFQTQMFHVWQPLLDVFVGDQFRAVSISDTGVKGRTFQRWMCLNPDVVIPPYPIPPSTTTTTTTTTSTTTTTAKPPPGENISEVPQEQPPPRRPPPPPPTNPLNTVELRMREDPGCIFWVR